MPEQVLSIDEQDVKLCNCADCGQTLLGESMGRLIDAHGKRILPFSYRKHGHVYMRRAGRPLCVTCGQRWLEDNPDA